MRMSAGMMLVVGLGLVAGAAGPSIAALPLGLAEQTAIDPKVQAQLTHLFPPGTTFSPKGGEPPHYKAYAAGTQTVSGLAFWTTELEPLERGFDGPIKILVGMDTKGVLTGIIVVQHNEPYGNFSVDLPRFPAQFRGKNIRDGFKVGADIDAVSRATMTVTSATRAIRNSARRVARAFLTPPGQELPSSTDAELPSRTVVKNHR
jgi:NosR/NirI family nitrous oxide reductase transcriptional regulator